MIIESLCHTREGGNPLTGSAFIKLIKKKVKRHYLVCIPVENDGEGFMDKRIKEFVTSIVKMNDSSERLSRGLAIGFFFGLSIFWGLQIVLALLFAQLLNANRKTAVIMTAVSNPFTTPFIYPLCYKIGHFIINDPVKTVDYSSLVSVKDVLNLGLPFLEAILTGTSVAGLAGGVVLYFISKKYLDKRKKASN